VITQGEAIIESTVTGNSPNVALVNDEDMLINQQQVFPPTNNALSDVGHVHLFLDQLGQGIQHIASRVPNLVDFIQRANTYRDVTGQGLSFLGIPRSYYGTTARVVPPSPAHSVHAH
jgi:4-hydroxyphenylpyruvate dioxygenase-like putative hemolysin